MSTEYGPVNKRTVQGKPRTEPGASPTIIEARAISRVYRIGNSRVHAIRNFTLDVPRGAFVSLMGPSGCGKTTLLNLIGCIDLPTEGELRVFGEDVRRLTEKQRSAMRLRKIGFVFQRFFLLPMLTAIENVELPMIEAGVPASERHRRAGSLLEQMRLDKRLHHKPHELSGGEMQRVAIARALANEPELVIADEPTGELDHATGLDIMNVLGEFRRRGITLIIATHNPEVAQLADRTLHLLDGEIQ